MDCKTEERIDAIIEFLSDINRYQPAGFAFLGTRRNWQLYYPSRDFARARRIVARHIDDDLYFCPTIFAQPRRTKANALPSAFSHCDCDEGNLEDAEIWPTSPIWTSTKRTSCLWQWDKHHSPREIEAFNYALVHQIKHRSKDKSGWEVTKFLRVPYTYNHKYSPPPMVRLGGPRNGFALGISRRPTLIPMPANNRPNAKITLAGLPNHHQVLRTYWRAGIRKYMGTVVVGKRSDVICAIICALRDQGASGREAASVALESGAFKSKTEGMRQPLHWLEGEINRLYSRASAERRVG